ncbi:MAG TPA: hypothetical protein P5092_05770 [Ruminococcus sp.]|nr:hypothetical protein [Ruminococcus sp.]
MFRKKKLDEMEQDIRNKSIIASHDFMSTVLLVWFVICMVMRKPAIIPLYLLVTQNAVLYISELILKRSVGDERWKKSLIILISVILGLFFAVLVSAGAAVGHGGTE